MKGQQSVIEIAERFDVHPNQVTQWKTQLLERAAAAFGADPGAKSSQPDVKELHAKIGQQALADQSTQGHPSIAGNQHATEIDRCSGGGNDSNGERWMDVVATLRLLSEDRKEMRSDLRWSKASMRRFGRESRTA
jgi:hypothetical protein